MAAENERIADKEPLLRIFLSHVDIRRTWQSLARRILLRLNVKMKLTPE